MSMTHHRDDDDIPFDIQIEIINRIQDVKPLIRGRLTSKAWKSVIDKIIVDYKSNNQQILVSYQKRLPASKNTVSNQKEWENNHLVSIVDDDSFPQHKHNLPVALPPGIIAGMQELIGTSHGLLCFYDDHGQVVVWNPLIRKSVTIPEYFMGCSFIMNFGVCPRTRDLKLVRIENYYDYCEVAAKIYTLSSSCSGVWRSLSINLPNKIYTRIVFECGHDHKAAIDGILYWHATTYNPNTEMDYHRIITFDLASEEFGDVCLPDNLARSIHDLSIFEYYSTEVGHRLYNAWKMIEGHGASSILFEKLFTIKQPFFYDVKGFRMNGQPIIIAKEKSILQVYDPSAEKIIDHRLNNLTIDDRVFVLGCYTETLFPLEDPDSLMLLIVPTSCMTLHALILGIMIYHYM